MAIGFKEWALVCAALGRGEQSIILRKGGIHEGRDGFRFEHREFFLFPTLFHEQVERTRLPAGTTVPLRENGSIAIRYWVRAEWTELLTEAAVVRSLARFHVWSEAEIESRFAYREAGLSLAFVRVFRTGQPWVFPDQPKFGGCRSWVDLPAAGADAEFTPVLDDAVHQEREREIRAILSP